MTDGPLVLGPLLRYVGETEATVWVETAAHSLVTVACGDRRWHAPTFTVKGHHYALVIIEGLESGTVHEYRVFIDEVAIWPPKDSAYPPPVVRTLDAGRGARLLFGSCRTTAPHDADGNAAHGVDALRTLALALARSPGDLPDLVAFLGDQVYADETTPAMRAFIAERRSLDEPPGEEIKDYEEYAHLYRLAWSDPANRWLLSTLPSCMIFDDHDIRDDWNTSYSWHQRMGRTSWWHERLMGALSSYWVYQHIGNLSPAELADDQIYRRVLEHARQTEHAQQTEHARQTEGARQAEHGRQTEGARQTEGEEGADAGDVTAAGAEAVGSPFELDLTDAVFDLARRADRDPDAYRWSYRRDLGGSRLVVVDSRAARVLAPGHRSMLTRAETAWLDDQLTGDVEHLLIGTSLPFLLPPGLHDFEAIDEALANGDHSRPVSGAAEKLRQVIDLEHWAAFNDGFVEVFELVMQVARGRRGKAPATVVFLSGDVHNSYVAEVTDARRHGATSRIVQAVCSPIRNPMPRGLRVMMSLFARGLVRPMRAITQRSKNVPSPPYPWQVTHGPWFDNCLAELTVEGASLSMVWRGGEVRGEDAYHPVLTTIGRVRLGPLDGSADAPVT
ncbi:MAG: alkaline phosphatase D family protein [Micrococcales bacterium]|nr:alkaline phosphatase D family protein [Micrococcales bacterium]